MRAYATLTATSRLIPTAAGSSSAATQQQHCNKKGGKAERNDCSWEGLPLSHEPVPAQLSTGLKSNRGVLLFEWAVSKFTGCLLRVLYRFLKLHADLVLVSETTIQQVELMALPV